MFCWLLLLRVFLFFEIFISFRILFYFGVNNILLNSNNTGIYSKYIQKYQDLITSTWYLSRSSPDVLFYTKHENKHSHCVLTEESPRLTTMDNNNTLAVFTGY